MKIEFSRAAEIDLEAIGDWIARENPERALSFIRELRLECFNLSDFPERYATYKSTDMGGVRRKPYGNYLIFYVADNQSVKIARILHDAQDCSDLF